MRVGGKLSYFMAPDLAVEFQILLHIELHAALSATVGRTLPLGRIARRKLIVFALTSQSISEASP